MGLLRLKAMAVKNGVLFPGLDSAAVVQLSRAVEDIPNYARQLNAFREQLDALKSKVGTDPRWSDADQLCKLGMARLESFNNAARAAHQAALKSGDLLPGEGMAGVWLLVVGLAAIVVGIALLPVAATVGIALSIAGLIAAIVSAMQALRQLADSVAPMVHDLVSIVPTERGVAVAVVAALLVGGFFFWRLKRGKA